MRTTTIMAVLALITLATVPGTGAAPDDCWKRTHTDADAFPRKVEDQPVPFLGFYLSLDESDGGRGLYQETNGRGGFQKTACVSDGYVIYQADRRVEATP